MSLPVTGQEDWGTDLNSYITNVVLAQANSAAASIATHQAATDPHGDRAYALNLVAPLTSGVNGPLGFLQLNNIGKIPNGVLPPGGGRTSAFDVVKDYAAPTNGTSASSQIQSALNDCATAGGGEVWVGDGNFGIDTLLYVQANTWLHLSPGATMTRIVNGGSGQAPAYMVANFTSSTGSGTSNILVEGGQWVFDGPTAAGIPMAFFGAVNVLVRDTSIRTLQGSPAVLFAGCTTAATERVKFATATPANARSTYASAPPAVRIETADSSVIAGLNAAIYTEAACNTVMVRGCSITGATASDGTGLYTAFGGIAGTTAAVASSFHQNIIVTDNTAVALPDNGTYPANWQSCTITNNQFSLNNGNAGTATWNPSAPGTTNQVITNNTSTTAATSNDAYYTSNSSGRTGTSLSIDPTLQLTVQANAVYKVDLSIPYSSGSKPIKYDFSLPSGQFNYTSIREESVSTGFGGNVSVAQAVANAAGTPDSADFSGSGIHILGLLQVGSTGGTFGFEWCQQSNAPGFPIVLLAGAYIYLTRVA